MPAPDYITPLGSTASFYDWFNSYNTNALGKLNKMYVVTAAGGDGIGVTFNPTSGGHTFSIASTINGGITFNGTVNFNGSVSLLNNVLVGNVTNIFSGDYTTISGFTAGTVVRVTSAGGLTLAVASSRENAESIGIVTECNSTESKVVLIGKISGSTLTQNLLGIGSGNFSTGCVYFLSGASAGKLIVNEPTEITQVSKPILIATGKDSGIVLPYRGQYLDVAGVCGGSGGVNTIILPITSVSGETESEFLLRPGSVVATSLSQVDGSYTSPSSTLYYYKAAANDVSHNMLGVVTGYAGSYAEASTVYLVVNPVGSVVDFASLQWNSSLEDVGNISLDVNGNPEASLGPNTSIGLAFTNKFLFYPITYVSSIGGVSSLTTASAATKNFLINGSLAIWQRKDRGGVSGVTWTAGSSGGYFADRWCVLNDNPTGQTFSVVRKDFAKNQVSVAGYPDYYFNFTGVTVGANSFWIENRSQDARQNGGETLLLSFYARNNSGATTQYFRPYVKQYSYSGASPAISYGSDVLITSGSWARYETTLTVPIVSGSTFDNEGYFAVGLKAKQTTTNVDLAQFMLENTTSASTPEQIDIDNEYRKCAFYYQRSYAPKDITGSSTTWFGNSSVFVNYRNSIGNCAQIQVNDLINPRYDISLPIRMRASNLFSGGSSTTVPITGVIFNSIKVYSPYDGTQNDAFNISAGVNMKDTQGSSSKNLREMYAAFGLSTSNADIPPGSYYVNRSYAGGTLGTSISANPVPNVDGSVSNITVAIEQGYALFDKLAFHYEIDLDLNQGF